MLHALLYELLKRENKSINKPMIKSRLTLFKDLHFLLLPLSLSEENK